MFNYRVKALLIFLLFNPLFCFLAFTQTPSNDECSGAITVAVNTNNNCTNVLTTSTNNATQSLSPCVGSEAKDIWYKFVATATTHRITITPISYCNLVIQRFSGTCGSLVENACTNPIGFNEQIIDLATNLTIGNTYYFRIYDRFGNGPSLDFTICINEATTHIDNDECATATNLVPSSDMSCNFLTFSNVGASQSPISGCVGDNEDDIWFSFTATSSRHQLYVSTNLHIDPVVQLFGNECGNLSSVGCFHSGNGGSSDQVVADFLGLTPGNKYYIRVYGKANNNSRCNIGLCLRTPPPPPANDECVGAIEVPVNNDGNCGLTLTSNTGSASQSQPACVGNLARDVWYKFVATSATHRLTISPVSYANLVVQTFIGNCGALLPLNCIYPSGLNEPIITVMSNLTIGQTYYFRIYDRFGNGPNLNFNICINSSTNYIDNDDCSSATTLVPFVWESGTLDSRPTNLGATPSGLPACFGTAEDDIWFKFTATGTRHQVWALTSQSISPILELYNNSCGNLHLVGCSSSGPNASSDQNFFDLNNFIPGNTYYLRVYGSAANNNRCVINAFIKTFAVDAPCPGGVVKFTSNINGSSYQWQVNTGLGFSNIPTNSVYYTGSTTNQLQVTDAPSNIYGHQYRCVVNGTQFSNTYLLRFASYWNGSKNSNWEDPLNWSCGVLPDQHTDVYITTGSVLLNSNRSCRSLTVWPGASVEVANGFTLNVLK